MKRFLFACSCVAFLFAGCDFGRHALPCPGESQVLRVESGDTFFFELEENATTGYQWDWTSDDPDVEIQIRHLPPEEKDARLVGAPSRAAVEMHIHRGYDGPSVITFRYRRPWEKTSAKEFVLTLYKRTGDCAFWE